MLLSHIAVLPQQLEDIPCTVTTSGDSNTSTASHHIHINHEQHLHKSNRHNTREVRGMLGSPLLHHQIQHPQLQQQQQPQQQQLQEQVYHKDHHRSISEQRASDTSSSDSSAPAAKTNRICHGRVSNLESMVAKDWWENVFDDMYLRTDGDVVEDPDVTREEVALLEQDPAICSILQKPNARILDLCCGQGRHLLLLAYLYPHLELHGHDQSAYLINLAKERARNVQPLAFKEPPTSPPELLKPYPIHLKDKLAQQENHPDCGNLSEESTEAAHATVKQQPPPPASFTVGDCRRIPHPDNSFDLVLVMGNSFGYFASDSGDVEVLHEIHRVLKPNGGKLLLDLMDGARTRATFAARSWEWVDDSLMVCRERALSQDRLRLVSREVITHVNRGVVRDQFYQERLYDRDELSALVESVGLLVDQPKLSHLVTSHSLPSENSAVIERHMGGGADTPTSSSNLDSAEVVSTAYDGPSSYLGNDDRNIMLEGLSAAADLSKRKEDLGMMEHRMLISAVKV